jgi:hypothetical protein
VEEGLYPIGHSRNYVCEGDPEERPSNLTHCCIAGSRKLSIVPKSITIFIPAEEQCRVMIERSYNIQEGPVNELKSRPAGGYP